MIKWGGINFFEKYKIKFRKFKEKEMKHNFNNNLKQQ